MNFRQQSFRLLLVASLLISAAAPAYAYDDLDGTHLLQACNNALAEQPALNADGHALLGYCAGLIHGVGGAHAGAQRATGDNRAPALFCLPDSMTILDGARVVVKFLNDNPTRLPDDATDLVKDAFAGAFPCTSKVTQ
jgi:hypothetical protein